MTLSALLTTVRKSLRSFGVANPDVEAETIISFVLGLRRSDIYLEPARVITDGDLARILGLVAERRRRFPLQYLLGEVEFMGLPFRTREGVFIPRPETEILVETVIHRAAGIGERLRILDLATGSGVIAISLARYLLPEFVLATDISPRAAELAGENARLSGVAAVVAVVVGGGLDFIRKAASTESRTPTFDIVVSNPPYVEDGEIRGLQPEVRDFEPRLALDGGKDGLSFIAGVLSEIPSILKERGIVAFEIGATQGEGVRTLFERAGLRDVEVLKDLAGRDRIVIGRA